MDIRTKILGVDAIGEREGSVTFKVNNGQYTAFFHGADFSEGEEVTVRLTHLDYPLTQEVIFSENKDKQIRIEKSASSEWSYYCYGKIVQVGPIVADFGDLRLNIGDWTRDEKLVGQYIYWNIDRLDIERVT